MIGISSPAWCWKNEQFQHLQYVWLEKHFMTIVLHLQHPLNARDLFVVYM